MAGLFLCFTHNLSTTLFRLRLNDDEYDVPR